ncbi:MAG: ribosomal L7Ae/L30e/S12e/Gadd45 family protein [Oscillospiraceae bacterium]|jgi:large subunit ribosomal protein L7A|nr:ribosomal L7Ae/L30e/S12e/Gadd45 family protein [Oscillospiraceae bacterium]
MLEGLRQANARAVGVKHVLRAVQAGQAKEVFVASDADLFLIKRVLDACYDGNVPCLQNTTARELGAACGIEVEAAAAAILRG